MGLLIHITKIDENSFQLFDYLKCAPLCILHPTQTVFRSNLLALAGSIIKSSHSGSALACLSVSLNLVPASRHFKQSFFKSLAWWDHHRASIPRRANPVHALSNIFSAYNRWRKRSENHLNFESLGSPDISTWWTLCMAMRGKAPSTTMAILTNKCTICGCYIASLFSNKHEPQCVSFTRQFTTQNDADSSPFQSQFHRCKCQEISRPSAFLALIRQTSQWLAEHIWSFLVSESPVSPCEWVGEGPNE